MLIVSLPNPVRLVRKLVALALLLAARLSLLPWRARLALLRLALAVAPLDTRRAATARMIAALLFAGKGGGRP